MKYEEDSDIESTSMPLVPSPKKKKKQVKTTDSKARGMLHFRGHTVDFKHKLQVQTWRRLKYTRI